MHCHRNSVVVVAVMIPSVISVPAMIMAVAAMRGGVGYVMLPGMKQRIARSPFMNHVQTIVRPARFGSAITASSGTTIHWLSRRTR